MREIKIKFCDFNSQLLLYGNWIKKILSKRYIVNESDDPDYVFFSGWGLEHLKYKDAIRIFYSHEGLVPDFNDCDYAISMNDIDFNGRNLRLRAMPYIDYMFIDESTQERTISDNQRSILLNRRFCNFVYSATVKGDKGHEIRSEFCKRLMNYKKVDCPGKVLNNMTDDELPPRYAKDEFTGKLDFLKKYKFTIAFEGTNEYSYTTERLMQALLAYTIPVYWGNPLVFKDYNTEAFINCNDYENLDEVIEEVKRLDQDDEAYMDMLSQSPMADTYDFNFKEHLDEYIYNIIEKGIRFNKNHAYWSTAGWREQAMWYDSQFVSMNNKSELKEPIVIYGAGDYGNRAIKVLLAHGYSIDGVCDSDKSRWGRCFFHHVIMSTGELIDRYHEKKVSLIIAINNQKIIDTIYGRFLDMEKWNMYYMKSVPLVIRG